METIIGEQTEFKEVPNHLWRKQSRQRLYNSKEYVDTTKCFETMFNPRASVYSNHCGSNFQSNEQFMMITTNQLHNHQSQCFNNPQSFFVCEQNTSDENVVGSKYLLVPPNLAPGYPSSNHPNAHVLTHQNSLPNHHVGYHRGSVAERSSSIITEHSVTSETPPMIGGGINTSVDADSSDLFFPATQQNYKQLNHTSGRRKSTAVGNNPQIINSTLPVPYNENAGRSASIVSLGPDGNRLPLIVKDRDTEAVRSQPNPHRGGRNWFQCYLCLGLVGFVTFWLVLMLRVYLHEKYWTWSYIW